MIVDIIAGSIFLISVIVSFLRGIIREVLTIAGLIAGVLAAIMIGPMLEGPIVDWLVADPENPKKIFGVLPPEIFASILAYGLTFFGITVLVSFLTHIITSGIHAAGLGIVNRLLGIVFGALRGALLISLLYLPFYYNEPEEDGYSWMAESHFGSYIQYGAKLLDDQIIDKIFPENEEDAEEKLEDTKDKIQDTLKESETEIETKKIGEDIEAEELRGFFNE